MLWKQYYNIIHPPDSGRVDQLNVSSIASGSLLYALRCNYDGVQYYDHRDNKNTLSY